MSRQTVEALTERGRFLLRPLGGLFVKGKSERLLVYEDFDADPPEDALLKQRSLAEFERAVEAMESGDTAGAARTFREILETNPSDQAAAHSLERCTSAEASVAG